MRLLSILCLTLPCFALPSVAGETPWQSVAPDVSIRLISAGKVTAGGKALVALEIAMPRTTKTYWRVPGETGLPVNLDFSASRGIAAYDILWPYPLRETKGNMLDYVYYGHTILPIELTVPDGEGIMDVTAMLGICSEICVPAQLRLSLPLENAPDVANSLRIRQAMAEVPIEWTENSAAIGDVALMPDDKAIGIWVEHDAVDTASLIAATPTGEPLFGAPQKSPHSDLVVLPILSKSDNSALDGMDVEVTFMTDMGAYVVSRTIESGDAMTEAVPGQ